ncbi:hypothetical protein WL57_16285 [Burkholderia cepacia]|nr:hypothetical protein WL57_16285 [Burkholderia cepacia]
MNQFITLNTEVRKRDARISNLTKPLNQLSAMGLKGQNINSLPFLRNNSIYFDSEDTLTSGNWLSLEEVTPRTGNRRQIGIDRCTTISSIYDILISIGTTAN